MNDLDEHYRQALTAPAWHYLFDVPEKTTSAIIAALVDAFHAYKASKTASDGTITVAVLGGGMLSIGSSLITFEGTEFYGTVLTKSAKDVEPWQCSGPFVRDELAFAFKLWADRYEPFQEVISTYGAELVLSLVCVISANSANIESLIHANEILSSFISASAKFWEATAKKTEKQSRENWKKIQRMGVAERQKNAGGETCRRLAARHKADHVSKPKSEIVDYVYTRIREPDYGLTLTKKTINRVIAGYERDARLITRQSVASP